MISKFEIQFDSKSFTLEHHCFYLRKKMLLPIYNNLPRSQANIYYSSVRLADCRRISTSSDMEEFTGD